MQVIIAEKPSVAREIAAIVGAKSRQDGFIEGNGYAVTWAFGHLVSPAMPRQYGIEGFRAENLPILPNPFILTPRQIRAGKEYMNDPGAVKQLEIIRGLFNKAERIVVATDAGREGELIFRYIHTYLSCNKPFDRLWISSLTDRAIREGLRNLRPGKEYDNLYLSAKARSEADWLVGINASQALSIAAGRGVYSLGRVQTPTLALICQRYLENKAFTPQTYIQLKLHTAKDATAFAALSVGKFDAKEVAKRAFDTITDAGSVEVVQVETKEVRQQPPLPYDLTALQKDANTRHGFSADKTLSIAQNLYEAKLITYPRTGSRYIPADVAEQIPALIGNLKEYPPYAGYAAAMDTTRLNTRPVDDQKVTDHHAILPTENKPGPLAADDRTIYEMVAGRLLEAFLPVCIRENTAAVLRCAGMDFTARASVILVPGWTGVYGKPEEAKEEDATFLPELSKGDSLSLRGCEVLEKQTKPRPIHTESTLLAAMETAGRELEDEAEREAMKASGIGTPATRAAVIETLFARDYVRRDKKSLVPTEKGLAVYEIVKDKRIADVAMTGSWELALSGIASGKVDAFAFHRSIEVYAAQITSELLAVKVNAPDGRLTHPCPKCKTGKVVFWPNAARCENKDCGLVVYRNKAKKELTDNQIITLLDKARTGVIDGFQNKTTQKIFSAVVAFDENYNTQFISADKNPGLRKKK